jgi:type III secretion protein W
MSRDTTSPVEASNSSTSRTQQSIQAQKLAQFAIAQESAVEEFEEWGDLNAWNPLAVSKNFQPLEKRAKDRTKTEEASKVAAEEDEKPITIERLQGIAEEYERNNDEILSRTLIVLRTRISKRDSAEDILRMVRETYSDFSLADEALEFLFATADPSIREKVSDAKKELNRLHGRDIKAGKNMGAQAREFATQGLGSPTALRDLYRSVVTTPRDAAALFQELSNAYPYDKMKTVIAFLLHALGSDMKSKGPSIDKQELSRLFTETRSMQAILAIYNFFKDRMAAIISSFERRNLTLPARINFELLAKTFMKFIQERYPSVDKALQLSNTLGIANETLAQSLIYAQYLYGMRNVAPRFFRDERHRQDVLNCFMDTIEELEEKLEEEKEEQE